jgi:hypothetical protein
MGFEQKTGMFTVAVIVDKSSMRTSQNGKGYMFMIVSDLERLDSLKLQRQMETTYKGNRDEVKAAMKSYSNGYKIAKFMSFGDSAKKTLDLLPGTVIAILNPKKLENKKAELTGAKQS